MGLNSSCQSDWCVKPGQIFCECTQKVFCSRCFTLHMKQPSNHRAYSTNQSSPSLVFNKQLYLKSDHSTEVYSGEFKLSEVIIKLQYFTSRSELNRKQEEAALQRSTRHPNICRCLKSYIDEQFTEGFKFVMIMEKAETDLEDEIRRRADEKQAWSEAELLNYLVSMTEALAFMQRNDMTHRDIKPANLLLFKGGLMKLADFGLSIQETNLNSSHLGVVGTFMYLSPKLMKAYKEIESGKNDSGCTDHNPYKSDVYSLGLTFLYMTTFEPPNGLNFNIEGTTYLQHRLQREIAKVKLKEIREMLKIMLKVEENDRPDFLVLENIVKGKSNRGNKFNRLEELAKPGINRISRLGQFQDCPQESFSVSEIPVESVFETCTSLITVEQILNDTFLPVQMKSAIELAIKTKELRFSQLIIQNEAEYIKILLQEHELISLDLSNCGITPDLLKIIIEGNLSKLESLILGKNKLGRKGAKVLKTALLPRLRVLRLWKCGIGNKGLVHLSQVFTENLTELFLGDNKINDQGAKTLSRHLPSNLQIISLCDNLISDEGVRHLAVSLNKHKKIQQIYLDNNKVNAIGLKYLLLYLPGTLKSLRLVGNELSEDLLEGISKKYKIIL